jgi:hypothetical protein
VPVHVRPHIMHGVLPPVYIYKSSTPVLQLASYVKGRLTWKRRVPAPVRRVSSSRVPRSARPAFLLRRGYLARKLSRAGYMARHRLRRGYMAR